jgi:hypothetical protein
MSVLVDGPASVHFSLCDRELSGEDPGPFAEARDLAGAIGVVSGLLDVFRSPTAADPPLSAWMTAHHLGRVLSILERVPPCPNPDAHPTMVWRDGAWSDG